MCAFLSVKDLSDSIFSFGGLGPSPVMISFSIKCMAALSRTKVLLDFRTRIMKAVKMTLGFAGRSGLRPATYVTLRVVGFSYFRRHVGVAHDRVEGRPVIKQRTSTARTCSPRARQDPRTTASVRGSGRSPSCPQAWPGSSAWRSAWLGS